ncbi:ankyrin repeat domain-containing protein [Wolbachia pipientis]|uniref:ankyrin repeat domain-containing protein n=1 Tax=Wolbachia pipientis TaxID=955 RepID=UPI0025A3902B|nr:ankyrin repeat domain-containing protein [Wolbachia pipientis]MDM8335780.1 ankyrin repeat domain-containing protein [Wolbachia pipientis]
MRLILDLSCTLLGLAANGYKKVVDVLAEADVNKVLGKGNTPLHLAAYYGHTEIVDILIEAGANLNAVNNRKDALLSKAAQHNNKEMVNILTKAGTSFLLFDKNGHIIQFLEKKAKKNGLYVGGVTALSDTVAAIALSTTGTVAVELIPIVIAVAKVAIVTLAVGSATHMPLKAVLK